MPSPSRPNVARPSKPTSGNLRAAGKFQDRKALPPDRQVSCAPPPESQCGRPKAVKKHKARVLPGCTLFTPDAWNRVATSLKLSPRELDVVQGIFDDLVEEAIASNHVISTHTVHTHVRRLFSKLLVKTRVELLVRVFAEFLILTISLSAGLPPICAYCHNGLCPRNGMPPKRQGRKGR